MDGCRPRDWSRHDRMARLWSRRFGRDMARWGARFEADIQTWERDMERGFGDRSGDGAYRRSGGAPTHGWGDDGQARRSWAERRAERRAERAERRAARAARAWSCSGRGGWMAWWWLVFPLFFLGRGALDDMGGWSGVGASIEGFWASMLNFTLAAPLAHVLADGLGVSFVQGFGLLALAALVSAGAAWIGLRAGRRDGAL